MKRFLFASAAVMLAAAAHSEPSENPAAAPDSVRSLNEITVTGMYRASSGADNTISADEIRERNHGQGPDYVLSALPNIYAYNDNGTQTGYTYFRLRGMGQERMNITFDGVPWNEAEDFGCYFSNSPDLMGSMHSMKVENGASVTTNGSAAYAGNVSLESADLRTDTISYAEIGAGSFNTYRMSTVYNTGVRDGWALHLRATQQQTSGYREYGDNNSQAFAFKIGRFFNDRHSIDLLSMTGFHRNGQGYMGVPKNEIPEHLNPFKQIKSGNRPQETDNFLTTYNRIQWRGRLSENVLMTSSFYWNAQNGDYRVSWYDPSLPYGAALNNYHLTYNMFGINTAVKWIASDRMSLTAGANGSLYSRKHTGYDVANADSVINIWHNPGIDPFYANKGSKPDMNAFASLKYSPVRNVNIQGSAQYRATKLAYRVSVPAFDDPYDRDFDHTWNFLNWSVSADWSFACCNDVYAKYSVVNREPSRTDLFGGEYITHDSPMNTQSERANDLEIGYMHSGRRLRLNVNVFYVDFDHELVATGELSPVNFLPIHKQMNTYRTGAELTATYNPFGTMEVTLNSSWLKTELREYGTECTFSPAGLAFGEISYVFPGGIKAGMNTQWRSKMYLDVSNEHVLPASWTLNAYMHARVSDSVELSLNINNLSNRLNMSNGSVDGDKVYYIVDSPLSFFIGARIML